LAPVNTRSPRSTLEQFKTNLEEAYRIAGENRPAVESKFLIQRALRCLNLENTPLELRQNRGFDAALMLKEVLDRVELPSFDKIPGDDEIEQRVEDDKSPLEGWTIPNTEIRIGLVAEGPRRGEYLFTEETVRRVPTFYERVRNLPYKEDATKKIFEAYQLTPGAGLDLTWEKRIPDWAQTEFAGQAIWQWATLALTLAVTLIVCLALLRFGRILDNRTTRDPDTQDEQPTHTTSLGWTSLSLLGCTILAGLACRLIDDYLNITGMVREVTLLALTVVIVYFICRLSMLLILRIGEVMIRRRQLSPKGASSQLIRLCSRLVALIVVVAIIVYTAQLIGLPAYSVITGLGVGGLAISFAAQQSLSNMIGSLVILITRPYEIGDVVNIECNEGTVVGVDFRSTQIRTFYDSTVAIPNSKCVSATIDNTGARVFRRINTTLTIRYDTPPSRIEAFLEGIKQIIQNNPTTRKDLFYVYLNDFGPDGYDIVLYLFVKVPGRAEELLQRHRILLEIVRLAAALDIVFAYPTRTLEIDTMPGQPARAPYPDTANAELKRIAEEYGAGENAKPEGLGIFTAPNIQGAKPDSEKS
jgi:MscS family membrane protein